MRNDNKKIILVTGGSGLIGTAIRDVVNNESKNENEEYIFLSSKDGDLM